MIALVLLLCTFWELCALFVVYIYILLFTDKKKKKKNVTTGIVIFKVNGILLFILEMVCNFRNLFQTFKFLL